MALTITDHLIRRSDTPHTAELSDGRWTLTWLPAGYGVAAAGGLHAARVLLRAVDVVGELVVHSHVVDLRGGLVVPRAPGLAAVHADTYALGGDEDEQA